jgi:hypothetical protein
MRNSRSSGESPSKLWNGRRGTPAATGFGSGPSYTRGDVLIQSYAADIWMGRSDGTTWRYQALYSETDIQGVQDSFDMRGFLSGGIEDSMLAHDEGIDGVVAR